MNNATFFFANKSSIIFFLILILGFTNYAQEESFPYPEIDWATYFTLTQSNFDKDGNYYFQGSKFGLLPPYLNPYDSLEVYVNNPEHPGHRFLGKLNNSQDIEFIKIFGPVGIPENNYYYDGLRLTHIRAVDELNNFYIMGLAEKEADIGTTGAYQENYNNNWSDPYDLYFPDLDITITIESEQCDDAFIMKYDENGNNLWGSYYNGNQNIKEADIIVNEDYIYLYGYTTSYEGIGTSGTYMPEWNDSSTQHIIRFFMQKLNAQNGMPIWGTYLDEPNPVVLSFYRNTIIVNSNGYIFYLIGDVLKILSPDGQLIGESEINLNPTKITGMNSDKAGNIYIIGYTENNDSIGTPDSYRPIKTYENQRYIVKYNQEGEKQWGSYLTSVEHSNTDPIRFYASKQDIYLATFTTEDGLATTNAFQETIAGGFDVAFMKIDGLNGNLKWLSYFGGVENEIGVQGIHIDENKNLYLSITETNSPSEQLITENALFPYPIVDQKSLLVKFLHENNIMSTKTPELLSLKLYPNPTQGNLFLQSDEVFDSQTIFTIYDLLGRKLKSFKGNQSQEQSFDISALSEGVYFLEINHQQQKQYVRFVKE